MKARRFWLLLGCALFGGLAALATRTGEPAGGNAKRNGDAAPPARELARENQDPVAVALGAARSVSALRDIPKLLQHLERLDPAQLGRLLAQMSDAPPAQREKMLPALLGWWTVRDPAAATAWLRPELDRLGRFSQIFYSDAVYPGLVEAWVDAASELAADCAREFAGRALADVMLRRLEMAWDDEQRYLEFLRDFPDEKQRGEAIEELFESWAQSGAEEALKAAEALPEGKERRDALAALFYEGIRVEARADVRMALLDRALALGVAEDERFPRILGMAAVSDPVRTAEWLEQQTPEVFAGNARFVVERWIETDETAALDWAEAHGVSLIELAGLGARNSESREDPLAEEKTLFQVAAENSFSTTIDWIKKRPAGVERDRYVLITMRELGAKWPLAEVAPLLALLPEEQRPKAAYHLIPDWRGSDADEAIAWAKTLPPGPVREQAWAGIGATQRWASAHDELLKRVAGDLTPADRDALLAELARIPAESTDEGRWQPLGHVLEIRDPAVRRRAFDDALAQAGEAPETRMAAREWLDKAAVPEEWKQPWREAWK